jgi:hypothetical protein
MTLCGMSERMIGGEIRGCNVWNLDLGNWLKSDEDRNLIFSLFAKH